MHWRLTLLTKSALEVYVVHDDALYKLTAFTFTFTFSCFTLLSVCVTWQVNKVSEAKVVNEPGATDKDSTQTLNLPSQQDSRPSVCESVTSFHALTESGRYIHRPALHCKPTPAQLGVMDDVTSAASRERSDLDKTSTLAGKAQ